MKFFLVDGHFDKEKYMESKLSFLNPSEHKPFSFENDIDSEVNLYDHESHSKYYSDSQFRNLNLQGFSIIHFSIIIHFSRSLYKHFDQIKQYLRSLKH